MQLCNFAHNVLSQKNNVQSLQQKHQEKMSIDFKNNIKNIKTMSPELCVGQLFNLQSKASFQFCFQVRWPVISTIADPFMSIYEKRNNYLIFDSKKKNINIFYFWKSSPKTGQIFQVFTLYTKGHFSITKLDILIFSNILHLKMDFWYLSWKSIVSS